MNWREERALINSWLGKNQPDFKRLKEYKGQKKRSDRKKKAVQRTRRWRRRNPKAYNRLKKSDRLARRASRAKARIGEDKTTKLMRKSAQFRAFVELSQSVL